MNLIPPLLFFFVSRLLLISVQLPIVSGDYKMIVYWGLVTNGTVTPISVGAIPWGDCVTACYESLNCVLAFGRPGYCTNYNYESVFEVQKLDADEGLFVALKTNVGVDCPMTPFEATQVEFIDPSFPQTVFSYEITFSEDQWSYSYSVNRSCPPDWKKFTRPSAEFCLRLYGSARVSYNQTDAAALCSTQNATLAGLESDEERRYAEAQGLLLYNQNTTVVGFWISGTRKSTCLTVPAVEGPDCDGIQGFDFSDTYLTTFGGYLWAPTQPDGWNDAGVYARCLQILVTTKPGNNITGKVDDNTCDYVTGVGFANHGFVCGKPAGF